MTFDINFPHEAVECVLYMVYEDKYAKIGDTVYCKIITRVNDILVDYKYKNVAVSELLVCPNKPSGFEC